MEAVVMVGLLLGLVIMGFVFDIRNDKRFKRIERHLKYK